VADDGDEIRRLNQRFRTGKEAGADTQIRTADLLFTN
jgi:hypothetical protein